MSAVVLQDNAGEQLGFLLLAGSAPLSEPGGRRCILTGFPQRPELFESTLGAFLQRHKHSEFAVVVTTSQMSIRFEIDCADDSGMDITIQDGKGTWRATIRGTTIGEGQCQALPGVA